MIATADLQFGVASQSFTIDCEDGPITSVTSVAVYYANADDTSTALAATTGAAAVDAVSTTTTAAAGYSEVDPRAVALTSAASVAVGRFYRLSALALAEDVEVVSISGSTVYARNPLINTYALGATFKALRASQGVLDAWAADAGNLSATFDPNPRYRVRWVLVVAGATRIYDRHADLVRYAARHGVTPMDVEKRFPGWLDRLSIDQRSDQGRSLISESFGQVKFDLWQDGKADTAIRNSEVIAELTIARAELAGAENGADAQRLDLATKNYRKRYDSLIRAPFLAVDGGGGGAAAITNRPMPIWRR